MAIASDVKARKRRVPDNLAEQYTETPKKRRQSRAAVLAAARTARRTAEERARLHQIMEPGDEVLRRLARIGVISSPLVGEDETDAPKHRRSRSLNGTSTRRPRRWELACGKCGHKGQFSASAGVCPRCGAITVRI